MSYNPLCLAGIPGGCGACFLCDSERFQELPEHARPAVAVHTGSATTVPVFLSPEAAIHDLRLLLHAAPESVKNAFFDLDVEPWLSGADVALHKAEWCDAQADRSSYAYDAWVYREAARLLRAAMPGLPEHAPPEAPGIRRAVDEDYSRSVAMADRRYLRRRR